MSEGRKHRGCLLFYVYAYFLGLGGGLIATISLSEKDPPLVTWILLPLGMVVSITTCVVHLVLTCWKPAPSGSYRRSIMEMIGLSLASILTYSGTFTFLSDESLFFLCGVFSGSCYLMATIALSVNRYQTWKRNNSPAQEADQEVAESHHGSSPQVLDNTTRDFIGEMELLSSSSQGAFFLPMYLGVPQPDAETSMSRPEPRSILSVISSGHIPAQTSLNTAELNPLGEGRGSLAQLFNQVGLPGRTSLNSSDMTPEGRGQLPLNSHRDLSVTQLAVPPSVSLPSYEEVANSDANLPPKYSELPDASGEISIAGPSSDTEDSPSETAAVDNFSVGIRGDDAPPDYYESPDQGP